MKTPSLNDVLAINLARIMGERGLTQASFAKLAGIGQTTVSLYLSPERRQPSKSGKIPSAKLSEVEMLAKALGVKSWELLSPIGTASFVPPESAANDDQVAIRHVPLKIAAGITNGHGAEMPPWAECERFYLPTEWLQKKMLRAERVFAATVKGLSMFPRVHEGDVVVIDPDDRERVAGQVYALSHEGEFTLKRLKRDGRRWVLFSDNPDQAEYKPVPCTEKTAIIGKVVLMWAEGV